jgi:hypothetical protein
MGPMARRELAQRNGGGLDVSLYWDPRDDALTVIVQDTREGARFEIPVESASALDAFEHPFAYLARYQALLAA